jgi:hypothetical protein
MNRVTPVDPRDLFTRLARELPAEVRDHVLVVGSLAAACHHAERIEGGRVRTKDADLVIHPASEVTPAALIAKRLRSLDWRQKPSDFAPGYRRHLPKNFR